MNRIVECVPNFSEGRRPEVVAEIVAAIEREAGAHVLNVHMDADHNRSVVTFVAAPERVVGATVRAVAAAAELIDLRQHTGEHPRIGATDVLPFVPISGVTMEECVRLAHAAGKEIAGELGIPVYFYERAARVPERERLEWVRRGGFEELREAIVSDPSRAPDEGERRVHETAGACIVGARKILIAFNVNLQTSDVAIARRIARRVRERDGGLPYVKALGIFLKRRNLAQVSMNLTNYEATRIEVAFDAVAREAMAEGVGITGSEIVGLVPQHALSKDAERALQIKNFSPEIVLENRLAAAMLD